MRHYPYSVTVGRTLHSQHRTEAAALAEARRVGGEAWRDFKGNVPSLLLTPRPLCDQCGSDFDPEWGCNCALGDSECRLCGSTTDVCDCHEQE